MVKLTNKDYLSILQFYKQKIPKQKTRKQKTRKRIKGKNLLKKQVETILNSKLCRCIKKLQPIYNSKSVGICTKSVFNNKGLIRGKFKCGKRRTIKFRKN